MRVDTFAAVLTCIFSAIGLYGSGVHRPVIFLIVLATTGLVALRRRFPIAVLYLASASFAVTYGAFNRNESTYVVLCALFTIGSAQSPHVAKLSERARATSRTGAAVLLSGVFIGRSLYEYGPFDNARSFVGVAADLLFIYLVHFLAWFAGDATGKRIQDQATLRTRTMELAQANFRLQHEQARNSELRVEEERRRIGRELHDVVGHNLSVISLQSGAARFAMAGQDRSRDFNPVLEGIENSIRRTLAELHDIVGSLRMANETISEPVFLCGIGVMAQQALGETRNVKVEIDDDIVLGVATISPETHAVGYRIAQEAITNSLKHSTGGTLHIRIFTDGGTVMIRIVDFGRPSRRNHGWGFGFLGMNERAASIGGHMRIQQTDTTFEVEATLPAVVPSKGVERS